MNFDQIQAFITLASTLNYTKASAILHTTQPNLSKIIVSIENEVGVQLFIRDKRDVRLTPAGKMFLSESDKINEQYKQLVKRVYNIGSGNVGNIRIGFLGTALVRFMPKVVNRFREKHPNITLELVDYTYSPLMDALEDKKIDIAFIPDRELNKIPKLTKKHLFSDDMCVVVHKDHRIAGKRSVAFEDILGDPIIIMDPTVSIRDYDLIRDIYKNHGAEPNIVYRANTLNTKILMVDCNVGITVLADHMMHFATKNVKFVNIKGYESYFKISCAWTKENNPCVQKLVDVVGECLND